jgi:hypothetical protein
MAGGKIGIGRAIKIGAFDAIGVFGFQRAKAKDDPLHRTLGHQIVIGATAGIDDLVNLDLLHLHQLAMAALVDGIVARDGHQPCHARAAGGGKAACPQPDAGEYLLQTFIGMGAVAQHADQHTEKRIAGGEIKVAKRGAIIGCDSPDQAGNVVFHHGQDHPITIACVTCGPRPAGQHNRTLHTEIRCDLRQVSGYTNV